MAAESRVDERRDRAEGHRVVHPVQLRGQPQHLLGSTASHRLTSTARVRSIPASFSRRILKVRLNDALGVTAMFPCLGD